MSHQLDAATVSDVEAILDHATNRVRELADDIFEWCQEQFLDTTWSSGANGTRYVLRSVPQPPISFAIRAAESLHPVATVFDHIAWKVALNEARANERNAKRIFFPICSTQSAWNEKSLLERFPVEAVKVFRRWQPFASNDPVYGRSELGRLAHPLTALQDLDNAAKHRTTHLIRVLMTKGIEVDGTADIPVSARRGQVEVQYRNVPGVVRPGDVLMSIRGVRWYPFVTRSVPAVALSFAREDWSKKKSVHYEQLELIVKDAADIARHLMRDLQESFGAAEPEAPLLFE
jgi:hypothetical protein